MIAPFCLCKYVIQDTISSRWPPPSPPNSHSSSASPSAFLVYWTNAWNSGCFFASKISESMVSSSEMSPVFMSCQWCEIDFRNTSRKNANNHRTTFLISSHHEIAFSQTYISTHFHLPACSTAAAHHTNR